MVENLFSKAEYLKTHPLTDKAAISWGKWPASCIHLMKPCVGGIIQVIKLDKRLFCLSVEVSWFSWTGRFIKAHPFSFQIQGI